MRCPNCGGLNKDDAKWCGQCLMRFDRITAGGPASASGPPASISPAVPASPQQARTEALASPAVAPAFGDEEGRALATWKCPVCLTENPLTLDVCSSCGTSLFEAFRAGTSKTAGVRGNPTVAAALSVLPGAGHIYLRRIGDASARLLIAAWWVGTAFAVSGRSPASLMVRVVFWLALVALATISAFDAYRQAEEPKAKPLLSSRLLLYWSLGMLGVLVLGLSVVTFSVQR